MNRAVAPAIAAFLALWLVVACLDISSPVTGIGGISAVLAPTPSVVVGEDSRDTFGDVQPLRVNVFAPNGDPVLDARVVFFAIDTTGKLRVDSATGIAHGDSLSPNARVVARVTPANGSGSLQTPSLLYPVVPRPNRVTQDSNVTVFEFTAPAASTDTFFTGLISAPMSVTVRGGADTLIQQYLVSFSVDTQPASGNNEPTVVLVTDNGRASTVDTTDASGHASRRLRLRLSALADKLRTDTVIVRVHVRKPKADNPPGRPEELPGSPVRFLVPIRPKF